MAQNCFLLDILNAVERDSSRQLHSDMLLWFALPRPERAKNPPPSMFEFRDR